MAWTAPSGHVYATGEVVSASTLNTYVKDNLIDLDRRTTATGAITATSETTTSTSYTNLATTGPAVTVTIGSTGQAWVMIYAAEANSGAGNDTFMGFAVSGASTVAAADAYSIAYTSPSNGAGIRHGATFLVTGLTAGSNTFTAKYRVGGGTGTFVDRKLTVVPLGS